MGQIIAALLAIKDIIKLFKEMMSVIEKLKERNQFKKNKNAQKVIDEIMSKHKGKSDEDSTRALADALRKL